ncbi:flagellar basal body P-ring formation chaperone FlgA [bacterium]|nr:flagellar basal body P-ring formation chaperone FlgA [bacterium]
MIQYLLILLTSITAIAESDRAGEIQLAVGEYYASFLNGKVCSWEIEFKRCPEISAADFEIVGLRGEDGYSIPRGARLCWLDAVIDGKEKSLPVTLNVKTREMVPIAMYDIPSRTELIDSLIVWKSVLTEQIGATELPDPENLYQYWTKVSIPLGCVITMPRLEPVPIIKVGQELPLVTRIGVVEIKTKAKALEDAGVGESITVINTVNGKRLKGIVEQNGIVRVE